MSNLSIYGSLFPMHYDKVHVVVNNTYLVNYYPDNNENIYFYYTYKNTEIKIINAYVFEGYLVIINSDFNYAVNEMTKINLNNYTVYCSNPRINITFDYQVYGDNIMIYLNFIYNYDYENN
jgi:hypothetical protein